VPRVGGAGAIAQAVCVWLCAAVTVGVLKHAATPETPLLGAPPTDPGIIALLSRAIPATNCGTADVHGSESSDRLQGECVRDPCVSVEKDSPGNTCLFGESRAG